MGCNWRAAAPKQGPKSDGPSLVQHIIRPLLHAVCTALSLSLLAAAHAIGAALPAGTESVPIETQDLVEAAIAPQLVLPQTALWQFDFEAPYREGAQVVCGTVNYQSAMRKYLGPQRFYAIIKAGEVTLSQLQDPPYVDPTGAEAARFKLLCDRK
jgi:hypothetical protein